MRALTFIFLGALVIFFSIQSALAGDKPCFNIGDSAQSYYESQLGTAYSIGFNGYEALCEMRCFQSKSCKAKCQSKHGVSQLGIKYSELDSQLVSPGVCQALSLTCNSICSKHSQNCGKSCGLSPELISVIYPVDAH